MINKDKIIEIFNAWRIAFNPNDVQSDLASKRIQICDSCEFKSVMTVANIGLVTRCSICGCALKGKIFTNHTYKDEGGSCPKEKWTEVEKEWLENAPIELKNITKPESKNIKPTPIELDYVVLKDNTEHYETYDGNWKKYVILPNSGTKILIECKSSFDLIIKTNNTNLTEMLTLKTNEIAKFVFENGKWIYQKELENS